MKCDSTSKRVLPLDFEETGIIGDWQNGRTRHRKQGLIWVCGIFFSIQFKSLNERR